MKKSYAKRKNGISGADKISKKEQIRSQMNRFINKLPITAGIIFLLTAIIAVASAWSTGTHIYDLGISFSSYVGLNYTISVIWFIAAIIILSMMTIYLVKTKMPVIKRIIYAVIFMCIFGTAFFPFNTFSDHPTALTIDLHNDIAIGLMLATTISFVLSVSFSKTRKQRITAVLSLAYAAAFILLYFLRFAPLFQTFFIWENMFIVLLILELHMEQYGEKPKERKNGQGI